MKTLLAGVQIGLIGLVLFGGACAPPSSGVDLVELPPPQALAACAMLPNGLDAEIWVSGKDDSCELDVDAADGSASGTCEIPGRLERTLHLDYFVMDASQPMLFRVLLAQAKVTLSEDDLAEAEITVDFPDPGTRQLADVTGTNKVTGEPTVDVAGMMQEVSDLDGDCPNTTDEACSNLGELCTGGDPFS